jgi:hypothetical protein
MIKDGVSFVMMRMIEIGVINGSIDEFNILDMIMILEYGIMGIFM